MVTHRGMKAEQPSPVLVQAVLAHQNGNEKALHSQYCQLAILTGIPFFFFLLL